MTRPALPRETHVRRLAEASAWRVRLSEADADSSVGFESWLAADPANAEAWTLVQSPWIAIGEAATSPELMAARRDALHRARRAGRGRWNGRKSSNTRVAGLLAAAVACVAVLVAVSSGSIFKTDYKTALGERRVVTLSDGSKVTLDSQSEVKVAYTRDARRLELLRGQARFDVAHNVLRPFSVKAGEETVVATGTAFNIDLMGPKVLVTLIEGHISVLQARAARSQIAAGRPWAPKPAPITLVAGQQLIVAPAQPPEIATASLDRTIAWETGQLVFEDEPLASVAARVSRYTANPVTVDPSAGDLRVSGVFNAGDVNTFVDTVTHYLPVQASDEPDGAITLRRKG